MDLSKDVLAFARERRRMCIAMESCRNCECYDFCVLGAIKKDEETDKRILEYVQAWSDSHPHKTYLMDFLDKFPNCVKDKKGFPVSCRKFIYPLMSRENCSGLNCSDCWNEPMPTSKNEG